MPIVFGDASWGKKADRKLVTASTRTQTLKTTKKIIDVSWLPLAARIYRVSEDLNDYYLFYVPAVTSDVPNRNLQGFPYEEVVYFNPLLGRPTYRTFVGKPVHVEHRNEDPTQAKGVIFDSVLVKVPKYDLYKIMLLVGLDYSKDPDLVRDALKGEVAWSMGALVDTFQCSVCQANVTSHLCNCFQHVGKGGILNERLVYELCRGVNYIEVSIVGDPADVTAWGSLLE